MNVLMVAMTGDSCVGGSPVVGDFQRKGFGDMSTLAFFRSNLPPPATNEGTLAQTRSCQLTTIEICFLQLSLSSDLPYFEDSTDTSERVFVHTQTSTVYICHRLQAECPSCDPWGFGNDSRFHRLHPHWSLSL